MKATKPWNNRRFIGTFDVENTTKGDSGRYRCIVHSDKGVGVSNYGELTIKREYLSPNAESRTQLGVVFLLLLLKETQLRWQESFPPRDLHRKSPGDKHKHTKNTGISR